tara:strand:+ start:30 stop:404 length:375 start_codon:yes stop_codon:yes gene_type:complete
MRKEDLKNQIKTILLEKKGGPTSRLTDCKMKLFLDRDASVTDTMTVIRVLQGVAVVGQTDHSLRSKMGRTVLPISIKFLPGQGDMSVNLRKLARAIKKAANVRVVKVLTVDDKPFYASGKQIVV